MIRLITFLKPFSIYVLTAWVIMIIVISLTPDLPVLKVHTAKKEIRLDYLIHFCEYGFTAFMAYLAFSGKNFRIAGWRLLLITACVILFALAEEFHQKMVPGRTFNIRDVLSNILGISAALALFAVINRISTRNEQ